MSQQAILSGLRSHSGSRRVHPRPRRIFSLVPSALHVFLHVSWTSKRSRADLDRFRARVRVFQAVLGCCLLCNRGKETKPEVVVCRNNVDTPRPFRVCLPAPALTASSSSPFQTRVGSAARKLPRPISFLQLAEICCDPVKPAASTPDSPHADAQPVHHV